MPPPFILGFSSGLSSPQRVPTKIPTFRYEDSSLKKNMKQLEDSHRRYFNPIPLWRRLPDGQTFGASSWLERANPSPHQKTSPVSEGGSSKISLNQVSDEMEVDIASGGVQMEGVSNKMNGSPQLSASPTSHKMSEADHGSSSGLSSTHASTSSYPTDRKYYVRERARLNTFQQWPVSFLPAETMAAAGFYYLRRDDIVRCAFCGVEVGNWVVGDDPKEDHKKWAPRCAFINGRPTDNVPLSAESSSVTSDTVPVGYDTCGPCDIHLRAGRINSLTGNIDENLLKLGVSKTSCPQHPEYATTDRRLRSFENWPISMQIKPDVLSIAGFFYTGVGDQTKCFQCGGGLKDWESNDDPFIEHAKWFPKCQFILNCKGKAFVDKVINDISPKEIPKSPSESALDEKRKSAGSPDSLNSSGSSGVHSRTSSFSDDAPVSDSKLCKICYKNEMGIVFLPCGHILACFECAPSLMNCAVCRRPVEATVRAFLS